MKNKIKHDYGSYVDDQNAEFKRKCREKEDAAVMWFFLAIAICLITGRVLGWL